MDSKPDPLKGHNKRRKQMKTMKFFVMIVVVMLIATATFAGGHGNFSFGVSYSSGGRFHQQQQTVYVQRQCYQQPMIIRPYPPVCVQTVYVQRGRWENVVVGYQTVTTTTIVGYQPVVTGYVTRKGLSYGHWETCADGQRRMVEAYKDWEEPIWGQVPIYQTMQVPITQRVWVQ